MPKKQKLKHRIPLDLPAKEKKKVYKTLFGSIRNKVLQKLIILWYNACWTPQSKLGKRLRARLRRKEWPISPDRLAKELTLEDVMELLHVSKRTAREYRDALQIIVR